MAIDPLPIYIQPGTELHTSRPLPSDHDYSQGIDFRTRRANNPEISRIGGYALSIDSNGWQREIVERLRVFDQELRTHFRNCGFDGFVNENPKFLPEELSDFDEHGYFFADTKLDILSKVVSAGLGLDIRTEKARDDLFIRSFKGFIKEAKSILIKQEALKLIAINTWNPLEEIRMGQECVAYYGGELDRDRTNNLLEYLANKFAIDSTQLIENFWKTNRTVQDLIDLVADTLIDGGR